MTSQAIVLLAAAILAVTNSITFFLMHKDKRAALQKQWRVPEGTLFLSAACFGALGGVLGMQLLRHKTKHWYFKLFFPMMLAVQLAALAAGAYFLFC